MTVAPASAMKMDAIRRVGRFGFATSVIAMAIGVILAVGSAIAAGDWWLAPQPWIGIGLTLVVAGLALTGVFALLLVVIEPLGWWRLLALPPAVVVGFFWWVWLVFGLPTTGPGEGPERDVRTILYSMPEMLGVLLVATLLIATPLAIARVDLAR